MGERNIFPKLNRYNKYGGHTKDNNLIRTKKLALYYVTKEWKMAENLRSAI